MLKACQIPETKLHQKLLQATKVIISLVKEKEALAVRLKEASIKDKEEHTPQHVRVSPTHSSNSELRPQVDKSVQVSRQSSTGAICRSSGHFHGDQSGIRSVATGSSYSDHSRGTLNKEHHDNEDMLDVSLASLKFTDSSLGVESIQQVLQMAEKDQQLLESDLHNDRGAPLRHSTPELELVGSRVPVQNRPLRTGGSHGNMRGHTKARPLNIKTKRVRNYNSKD